MNFCIDIRGESQLLGYEGQITVGPRHEEVKKSSREVFPQSSSYLGKCCLSGTYFLLREYEANEDDSSSCRWHGVPSWKEQGWWNQGVQLARTLTIEIATEQQQVGDFSTMRKELQGCWLANCTVCQRFVGGN